MHTAVLTYDFLLAPAHCAPEEIVSRVAELAEYARSVQLHAESPIIEEDAVEKLHNAGNYPCDGLFKTNLAKLDEHVFTVKDISRIINGILSSALPFSYAENRLWEIANLKLNPSFNDLNSERKQDLIRLIETVAVYNEVEDKNYSLLHYCKNNIFKSTEVSAEICSIYPATTQSLPHAFARIIKLNSSYRDYLTSLCLQNKLTDDAENIELIKECFYWGSLCDLKKRGLSFDSIMSTEFQIGPSFINSLKMNQCLPGQKFWGSCFSAVVAILTDDSSYDINTFRKSAKSEEQRTSGNFRAFRCHVTKTGSALRLMFWKNDCGLVVLANVGPKNEETIGNPM